MNEDSVRFYGRLGLQCQERSSVHLGDSDRGDNTEYDSMPHVIKIGAERAGCVPTVLS